MNDEKDVNTNVEEQAAVSTPKAIKEGKAPKAKKTVKKAKKAKVAKSANGAAIKGPQVLREYLPNYHRDTEHKTAGGHVSIDNDDDIAKKLRGKDLDAVYALTAKALDEPEKELRAKYAKLNVGMVRMNLGNRLRAHINAK